MAGAGRLIDGPGAIAAVVGSRLPDRDRVIALSGGADSAIVAWAAARHADGRRTRAAFVHHHLAHSDRLCDAAVKIAGALGLAIDLLDAPVPSGSGLEMRARSARHVALEANLAPGEVLVTGHTADDQAETVLGNLLRGAGSAGLSGIPARRGRWIRPLLSVQRDVVRTAALELALPFEDDPDNLDTGFRRNLLRHEVIPHLAELVNPSLKAGLRQTAELIGADDEMLEAAAAEIPVERAGDAVSLPASLLTTLPVPIASRVVRNALRLLRPPYGGSYREVADVLRVVNGDRSRVSLGGGLIAQREGPELALYRPSHEEPEPVALLVPGTTRFADHAISTTIVADRPGPRLGGSRAVADPHVGEGAVVRALRPGERIPMGDWSKSAREALAEAGVPARLRSTWPVVDRGGTIVWLVGVRMAPFAAASPAGPFLVMEIERTRS